MEIDFRVGSGVVVDALDFQFAAVHGAGDGVFGFRDEFSSRGSERYLGDYQCFIVNNIDFGAVADFAALRAVVVFAHIDGAAGGDIGVDFKVLSTQNFDGCIDQFVEVVGQDFGGHAHAHAVHALRQQQREFDG